MEESGSGTYLEDFIMSLDILPTEFRREVELIKMLDKESYEANKELVELQKRYLESSQQTTTERSAKKQKTESNSNPSTPKTPKKDIQDKLSSPQLKDMYEKIQSMKKYVQSRLTEKVSVVKHLLDNISQYQLKLDQDLHNFEYEIRGTTDYDISKSIPPHSQVACRLSIDTSETQLILGEVINYRNDLNAYEIMDIDDKQHYTLPETQVFALDQADGIKRLSKGDTIYALYPDTTIFYPAVIIQIPKRNSAASLGGNGNTLVSLGTTNSLMSNASNSGNVDPIVTVQFLDDEDSNGAVPNRSVPMKFIIRV